MHDENGNYLEMKYYTDHYERIKTIITGCTRDEDVRKSLFAFYLLYTSESYAPGTGVNFYMEYGKEIAPVEQDRARCVRSADQWEEIHIKFDVAKADRNSELLADEDEDYFPPDEETIRERSTNPVSDIIIRWGDKKTVYPFDSHKLNYAKSQMTTSSNPYHQTFKALCNGNLDVKLNSGELFDEMKRVALWALYVDRHYEGFGSFGDKGKSIIKKVAKAVFPIYRFLVTNSVKLSPKYSYDQLITQLLGLESEEFDRLTDYLGVGFSESHKVSICWRQ